MTKAQKQLFIEQLTVAFALKFNPLGDGGSVDEAQVTTIVEQYLVDNPVYATYPLITLEQLGEE